MHGNEKQGFLVKMEHRVYLIFMYLNYFNILNKKQKGIDQKYEKLTWTHNCQIMNVHSRYDVTYAEKQFNHSQVHHFVIIG